LTLRFQVASATLTLVLVQLRYCHLKLMG